MDKSKLKSLIYLTPLLLVFYFFRPWIQQILLGLYKNPYVIQAAALGLITIFIVKKKRKNVEIPEGVQLQTGGLSTTAGTTIFFIFLMLGGVANTAYTNVEMSQNLQQKYTEIDTLPDIDNENPRILPRTVADEFAENSLQEPRHRIGSSDIAISEKGKPQWSYPLKPDGTPNVFLINQKGAAYADMSTSKSNISYNNQEMEVGVGMQITDNINWHLKKQKYWVDYKDRFMLQNEGENYIATPYVEYDFHFKFPIIYTTPEWGGVALTDSEGQTEYVDSEEVQNHEILQRQRNYPFELARKYVSSMEYREGIINKWFFHENQLEVAPVPGFNNDQPFMILTEDNPELFVATEPYGDASGLFEIWTIDGVTGKYELYKLDRNEGLIGANRAVNFVRQANSRVNWAGQDSNTGFAPIEPLPVIVDDKLYWQVRVVPLDSAGIAFTSFVDAETSEVYTAQNDQDIINFLDGKELEKGEVKPGTGENQTTSGGVKISILEDGEVVETYQT